MRSFWPSAAALVALCSLSRVGAQSAESAPGEPAPVDVLRGEAERLRSLVQSKGAEKFLDAARELARVEPRVVFYDAAAQDALTPEEHAQKTPEEQTRYEARTLGEDFYYQTKYGTPLAYARVIDLVCQRSSAGDGLSGKRVLDFGYGGIGHLRLLASVGATVVGVDVDPLLRAFYRESDQGPNLRLVHGQWPAEESVKAQVGGDFALILSKNTLKKGYITPREPVDPKRLVHLGVSPEEFLRAVAAALAPGGLFAIYNLCPAQKPERYIPWADGQSPFTREQFAAAGLDVLAFDVDDTEMAHELAWALKWDEQGMSVEDDLFAWFTLVQRPARPR